MAGHVATTVKASAKTLNTTMTDRRVPRIPPHVVVMLGATTAGYALALAGVAGLQAKTEAALTADRAPALDAVGTVGSSHDRLTARLDEAADAYAAAADEYRTAGGALDALQAELGDLASIVAEIDGVSRSLPASVRLPPVVTNVVRVRVPTTHGTTGASGG